MRLDLGLFVVSLLAFSCDSVLGISEPTPRIEEDASAGSPHVEDGGQSGEGGETGNAAGGQSGGTGILQTQPAAGQGGAAGQEGLAGSGGAPSCALGETRCGGAQNKTPETCDAGEWVVNTAENAGEDCPLLCVGGQCHDCGAGDKRCEGNVPETCVDGAWQSGTLCQAYCQAGECRNPPSCSGGLTCAGSVNCCRTYEVPGGSFKRDFDDVDYLVDDYDATVSTFLLDAFEVTVARFRKFADAYPNLGIEAGDGKAPHIADDLGWQDSFPLPATREELQAQFNSCSGATWTDNPSVEEDNHPVNCASFFVAYAFCIWDGGRLPTEAEWNYAAAGGDEQRAYPWSDPAGDTFIDTTLASYNQVEGPPPVVGSTPLGNARWEHADLAGSVYEWTLDFYLDPYATPDCDDCLQMTDTGSHPIRGGSFNSYDFDLRVALRTEFPQDVLHEQVGFRCARDVAVAADQ